MKPTINPVMYAPVGDIRNILIRLKKFYAIPNAPFTKLIEMDNIFLISPTPVVNILKRKR